MGKGLGGGTELVISTGDTAATTMEIATQQSLTLTGGADGFVKAADVTDTNKVDATAVNFTLVAGTSLTLGNEIDATNTGGTIGNVVFADAGNKLITHGKGATVTVGDITTAVNGAGIIASAKLTKTGKIGAAGNLVDVEVATNAELKATGDVISDAVVVKGGIFDAEKNLTMNTAAVQGGGTLKVNGTLTLVDTLSVGSCQVP